MAMYIGTYVFIIAEIISGCIAGSWHYGEEDNWPGYCKSGLMQSPINLQHNAAQARSYVPLNLTNYYKEYSATVTNNGHSVVIRFQKGDQGFPKINGAGLPDVYVLDHLHFHWQSEHTLDDYRFPLEMHLVHYAEKYKNLDNAALYPQGVAVLAVLFDISPDDDEYFVPFIEVMEQVVQSPSEVVPLQEKLTAAMFIPRDHAGFYRYEGSLTTPKCNEGVLWTIFTNTLSISMRQVQEFEKTWTEDNSPLTVNFRSIQPLNGRTVFVRISPIRGKSTSNASITNISSASLIILLCISTIRKILM